MHLIKIIVLSLLAAFFIFGNFVVPRFFGSSELEKEVSALKLENESLKSALTVKSQESGVGKTARIYSTYPLNNRHELTIALGQVDGIKEGMPAVLAGNVVIGQVVKTAANYSSVRTVFDPDWKISVRIGNSASNALLAGGPEPKLTLIDKKFLINEGDVVYSAAKGFPYGAVIGRVGRILDSPTAVFKEAELILPYELDNKITELRVLTSYDD